MCLKFDNKVKYVTGDTFVVFDANFIGFGQ